MSSEPQHPLQDARRRRMLGALGAAGLCALAPWERALA